MFNISYITKITDANLNYLLSFSFSALFLIFEVKTSDT